MKKVELVSAETLAGGGARSITESPITDKRRGRC